MITRVVSAGSLSRISSQKLFRDGIDVGGGFIQDQQFGIAQCGAHEGDELLLAQADAVAAAGDFGVQPFRKRESKLDRLDFSRTAASCSVE